MFTSGCFGSKLRMVRRRRGKLKPISHSFYVGLLLSAGDDEGQGAVELSADGYARVLVEFDPITTSRPFDEISNIDHVSFSVAPTKVVYVGLYAGSGILLAVGRLERRHDRHQKGTMQIFFAARDLDLELN